MIKFKWKLHDKFKMLELSKKEVIFYLKLECIKVK